MTSFQSSELTELPVVENSQLFAQRARTAHGTPPKLQYVMTQSNLCKTDVDICLPKCLLHLNVAG